MNYTQTEINEMLDKLENAGFIMDFLDDPYTDGTYKTQEEKNRDIIYTYQLELQ